MGSIPFAKIMIVLAVGFGIALGLCGVTFILSINGSGNSPAMNNLLSVGAPVELIVIALFGLGLVFTVIVWVVVSVFGLGRGTEETVALYGDKDDEQKPR